MKLKKTNTPLSQKALEYQKKMTNPIIFWFAMLIKLPSAIFWKLKIKTLDLNTCEVSIPYTWRTQNPFKSIYFAAMAGAAELSTGALCQLAMVDKGKFSMLVVDFRAEYYKKANQKILFACSQGAELQDILRSLTVNATGQLTLVSVGANPQGEEVAKFFVTWSFKRKS